MALTFLPLITIVSLSLFFLAHTTPSPSPSPSPSGDSAADTPISPSELLELSLPEIGVQRKLVSPEMTEGCKVASKQLEAIERKINEFQTVLKNRLTDPKTLTPTKKCLKQCRENLAFAIDDVKTGIESIRKNDLYKANADVSAIAIDVGTCNECFIDLLLEDQEIKAFDDWVRGVTGDCLVNLKKT